jgi:transposase-like protein
MPTPAVLYRGCRFAGTIISHCVWLYGRFNLSLRKVVTTEARKR